MTTAIAVIVLFAVLISIHEFGHLIAAKKSGVKVNEFAIGMGPKLFSKQYGETMYSVRLLPIGGYCAMEGEDEETDDDRGFSNASYPRRAIILAAGSICNFLLAIVIMIGIMFYVGSPTNSIGAFSEESPAKEAGLEVGDEIIAINGSAVESWDDVIEEVTATEGSTAELEVVRDGETLYYVTDVLESEGRKIIGITAANERDFLTAVPNGIKTTWAATTGMVDVLRGLFTGEVGVEELTGPIGITYVVNESLNYGVINFMYLMALISINLGIMNLLPLPALDGGRLLFLLINRITGKAVSEKVEGTIHLVGMVALLGLAVYIAGHDIQRFVLPLFQ